MSWDWRTSGYDTGERIRCTITGGSGGAITVDNSSGSYTTASRSVSGISGSITIQFSTNANRKNERGYIDNVNVE